MLIGNVNKLTDFTSLVSNQSDDVEQILHVLPNAMANFYNIYNPAQGTANGLLGLPEFSNPIQFICGNFDGAGTPEYDKRTEICRQRMAPVLKRLAVNYPPIMAHGINTITAYKGQVIYDTPATEAKAQTYIPYLEWIPSDGRQPASGRRGYGSQFVAPATEPGSRPTATGAAVHARSGSTAARTSARSATAGPGSGGPAARTRTARPAAGRGRRADAAGRSATRRRRRMTRKSLGINGRRATSRTVAIGSGVVLLAGCQFGGLNSLNMPGTAGHGTGSYTITVELPDVATLPQNSPVMVDDVTVGSVSGVEAVQRADGTFYAAVKISLDGDVKLPANATAKVAQTSLLGSQHIALSPPVDQPPVGELRDGSEIPRSQGGRYPTTEEVLSALGVVVNKGNLGALQDITQEVYNGVAGRQGQFAGLIPRLAELAASLNRQTDDIIAAAEGLNRFAGVLARNRDSLGRALDTLPERCGCSTTTGPTSSTRSPHCRVSPRWRHASSRRRRRISPRT